MERLEAIQAKADVGDLIRAERLQKRSSEACFVLKEDSEPKKTEEEEEEEDQGSLLSPDDSILILTGANASGKSVFLKTVAIIIYMVRISLT